MIYKLQDSRVYDVFLNSSTDRLFTVVSTSKGLIKMYGDGRKG